MADIKIEDIFGYSQRGNHCCLKCAKKEGITDFTLEELLLREEIELGETIYFCDVCGKQIE